MGEPVDVQDVPLELELAETGTVRRRGRRAGFARLAETASLDEAESDHCAVACPAGWSPAAVEVSDAVESFAEALARAVGDDLVTHVELCLGMESAPEGVVAVSTVAEAKEALLVASLSAERGDSALASMPLLRRFVVEYIEGKPGASEHLEAAEAEIPLTPPPPPSPASASGAAVPAAGRRASMDRLRPEKRSYMAMLLSTEPWLASDVSKCQKALLSLTATVISLHGFQAVQRLGEVDASVEAVGEALGTTPKQVELLWRKRVASSKAKREEKSDHFANPITTTSGILYVGGYLWKKKRKELMACVAIMVYNATYTNVESLALSYLFDVAIPESDNAAITLMLGSLSALFFVSMTLRYYYSKTVPGTLGYTRNIRLQLTEHLANLPQEFHDRVSTTDLMAVLTTDTLGSGACLPAFFSLVDCIVNTLTLTPLLFWYSIELTAFCVAILPVGAWLLHRAGVRVAKANQRYGASDKYFLAHIEEILSLHTVSEYLHLTGFLVKNIKTDGSGVAKDVKALKLSRADHSRTAETLKLSISMLTVIIGSYQVAAGGMAMGDFLGFNHVVGGLGKIVTKMASAMTVHQRGRIHHAQIKYLMGLTATSVASAVSLKAIANAPHDSSADDDAAAVALADPTAAEEDNATMSIERVTFQYPDERQALKETSVRLVLGRSYAVVGRSGAGKSTLVKTLACLYDPQKGHVAVRDYMLHQHFSKGSVRRDILSVMEQETLLFDTTVRENIRMGRLDATDADVERAASLACLEEDIAEMPYGYDTVVGARGRHLSVGQRQRIGLARVLVRDTPILIVDEPVSFQDTEIADNIVANLLALQRDPEAHPTTLLYVTSQLTLGPRFDSVVLMHHGRVECVGPHAELAASERNGVYGQLLRSQSGFVQRLGAWAVQPERLQQLWMFAGVERAADLAPVASMFTTRKCIDGELIVTAGQPSEALIFIVKGVVEVSADGGSGGDGGGGDGGGGGGGGDGADDDDDDAHQLLQIGACIEELSIVDEEREAALTYTAREGTTLLVLQKQLFANVLESSPPSLAQAVTRVVKARARMLAVDKLAHIWTLAFLDTASLSRVVSAFETETYEAGSVLFDMSLDRPCASLYIVISGSVLVTTEHFGRRASRSMQAGAIVGEAAVMLDAVDLVYAECHSNSVILSLSQTDVGDVLATSAMGQAVFSRLAETVRERDRLLDEAQAGVEGPFAWLSLLSEGDPTRHVELLELIETTVVPQYEGCGEPAGGNFSFNVLVCGRLEGEDAQGRPLDLGPGDCFGRTPLGGVHGVPGECELVATETTVLLHVAARDILNYADQGEGAWRDIQTTLQVLRDLSQQKLVDSPCELTARELEHLSRSAPPRLDAVVVPPGVDVLAAGQPPELFTVVKGGFNVVHADGSETGAFEGGFVGLSRLPPLETRVPERAAAASELTLAATMDLQGLIAFRVAEAQRMAALAADEAERVRREEEEAAERERELREAAEREEAERLAKQEAEEAARLAAHEERLRAHELTGMRNADAESKLVQVMFAQQAERERQQRALAEHEARVRSSAEEMQKLLQQKEAELAAAAAALREREQADVKHEHEIEEHEHAVEEREKRLQKEKAKLRELLEVIEAKTAAAEQAEAKAREAAEAAAAREQAAAEAKAAAAAAKAEAEAAAKAAAEAKPLPPVEEEAAAPAPAAAAHDEDAEADHKPHRRRQSSYLKPTTAFKKHAEGHPSVRRARSSMGGSSLQDREKRWR